MDKIKEIIQSFEEAHIQKLKIEYDGLKMELEKSGEDVSYVSPIKQEEVKQEDDFYKVTSPIVGTFYDRKSPDADPFVKKGDYVKVGDTLCIIEAMKVMNEITAQKEGYIQDIFLSNEDFCEYDRLLMTIGDTHV